jgi:hypothetical protein
MPRVRRCSYKEGKRGCPRDGVGEPSLCTIHRIAVATASMPPSPAKVITDSLLGFFSGKPVDVGATVGAVQDAYAHWGASRMGALRGVPLPPLNQDAPRPGPGPSVDHEADDRAEIERVRRMARRELGFHDVEPLTESMIKDRQRKLARKYHPDLAGGAPEKTERLTKKMAAVNAAADVLLEALE